MQKDIKQKNMMRKKSRKKKAQGSKKYDARSRRLIAKTKVKAARPIHKRLILHPATVLLILCAGVLIIGCSYKAVAGSYTVHGKIPAPALTDGAVITSPTDGTKFSVAKQTVSGTCPDNSYVKLYINNTFNGVAWCTTQTFQITATLYSGSNVLRAQDYNMTDDTGPASPLVTVTYTPPPPPPNNITGTPGSPVTLHGNGKSYTVTGNGTANPPLLLTADFHYQTFLTASQFKWSLDLEGGVPPYTVYINWGDGQHSKLVFKRDPVFWIQHVYLKSGYYPITIKSVDAVGNVRIIQLAALIKASGAASIFNIQGTNGTASMQIQNPITSMPKWLLIAWPVFIVLLLMLISFWLGERETYYRLIRRGTVQDHLKKV